MSRDICFKFVTDPYSHHSALNSHPITMSRCLNPLRSFRPLQTRIVIITKSSFPKHVSPRSTTRLCVRGYASSSSSSNVAAGLGPGGPAQSGIAMFAPLTNELDKICPRFEIDAGDVEVLRGPVEFYEVLKVRGVLCCD